MKPIIFIANYIGWHPRIIQGCPACPGNPWILFQGGIIYIGWHPRIIRGCLEYSGNPWKDTGQLTAFLDNPLNCNTISAVGLHHTSTSWLILLATLLLMYNLIMGDRFVVSYGLDFLIFCRIIIRIVLGQCKLMDSVPVDDC